MWNKKKKGYRRAGEGKFGHVKRKHAKKGIHSCIVAVCLFFVIAALIAITYYSKGKASGYIGGIGFCSLLFAVIGIVTGIRGFKEREKNYITCKIGIVLNSIVFIGLVTFFVGGLV